MATIEGHENLLPKKVLSINSEGHLMVDYGPDGVKPYQLSVGSSGRLTALPIIPSTDVDQATTPKRKTAAEKWHGVDQFQG